MNTHITIGNNAHFHDFVRDRLQKHLLSTRQIIISEDPLVSTMYVILLKIEMQHKLARHTQDTQRHACNKQYVINSSPTSAA